MDTDISYINTVEYYCSNTFKDIDTQSLGASLRKAGIVAAFDCNHGVSGKYLNNIFKILNLNLNSKNTAESLIFLLNDECRKFLYPFPIKYNFKRN